MACNCRGGPNCCMRSQIPIMDEYWSKGDNLRDYTKAKMSGRIGDMLQDFERRPNPLNPLLGKSRKNIKRK